MCYNAIRFKAKDINPYFIIAKYSFCIKWVFLYVAPTKAGVALPATLFCKEWIYVAIKTIHFHTGPHKLLIPCVLLSQSEKTSRYIASILGFTSTPHHKYSWVIKTFSTGLFDYLEWGTILQFVGTYWSYFLLWFFFHCIPTKILFCIP